MTTNRDKLIEIANSATDEDIQIDTEDVAQYIVLKIRLQGEQTMATIERYSLFMYTREAALARAQDVIQRWFSSKPVVEYTISEHTQHSVKIQTRQPILHGVGLVFRDCGKMLRPAIPQETKHEDTRPTDQ